MIVAAAINHEDKIYIGKRHCFIIRDIIKSTRNPYNKKSIQGFVDDKGNFLNRKDAADHALACGQIAKLKYSTRDLFSEDLW